MKEIQSIGFLANILRISGTFDLFGAVCFALLVGMEKSISNPPTPPFYSLIIASFLLCFAIMQFITSINLRDNLLSLGIITLSRVFYVILFFSYFIGSGIFPDTFLPTAIADLIWVIVYLSLTGISKEIQFHDLFLPNKVQDGRR